MKTRIVKIGNSQGIKIPKKVIKQCEMNGKLSIEVSDKTLTIDKEVNPRKGWEEAFKKAGAKNDDARIDGDGIGLSSWDENEWKC